MFQDSPFGNSVPAFLLPVDPPGVDPFFDATYTVCFNEKWLKYIVTCLYQLVLQSTWKVSTEDELNLVQAQAMTLISMFIQGCKTPPTNIGNDTGIEQMIRQNPSNPCLLETSIDGINWCAFADLSKCVPSVTQPGSGSPQPSAGGGQACYHADMQGSGKWLLPTLVNTGDVIEVTNAKGAYSDGTVVWYCPSGALFQLGTCFGSGSTSSTDPLNTSPHMELIAKINGVYYPMFGATLTIPSGVTAQSVEFQANDVTIADNYGSISFDVCVTNNQANTFTHVFDFTTTDGGFSTFGVTSGVAGVYSPGVGWTSSDFINAGASFRGFIVDRSFPSRTITRIRMTYDLSGRATNQPTTNEPTLIYSGLATGVLQALTWAAESNGNGKIFEWNGSTALTAFAVEVASSWYIPTGTYAGSSRLSRLEVSGIGTDPF